MNWRLAPTAATVLILAVAAALCPFTAHAGNPVLPPQARQGLEKLNNGDADGAIADFRALQASAPDQPLGYLLEGGARWSKTYCATLEVKWGMVVTGRRGPQPGDEEYLGLAEKTIHLAAAQLVIKDSAEMHLYMGLAMALEARLYGMRSENRATAHAGVRAREEFLRAKQLDPEMTDADTGLGLYNYYVDTLSGIVKMLRFFMGIPGGNKQEGIRQLESAMNGGGMTAVEARFYLAKNLRTYDQQYERAAVILEPLVQQYPRNSIFRLFLGNFDLELNRREKAMAELRAAAGESCCEISCAGNVMAVADSLLATVGERAATSH
jgi:tetratricopeptide repeat protein